MLQKSLESRSRGIYYIKYISIWLLPQVHKYLMRKYLISTWLFVQIPSLDVATWAETRSEKKKHLNLSKESWEKKKKEEKTYKY